MDTIPIECNKDETVMYSNEFDAITKLEEYCTVKICLAGYDHGKFSVTGIKLRGLECLTDEIMDILSNFCLYVLDIADNNLTELPVNKFKNVRNVRFLYAWGNNFTPSALNTLRALENNEVTVVYSLEQL